MTKKSGVIGGAFVPHAPQMLSLPKTEDAEQVARVRAAMLEIGDQFRNLNPDVVIVVCHDHGDDFLQAVPPFMIHCAGRAEGQMEHAGLWNLRGDIGYRLFEALQEESFDPAYTLTFPLGTPFTIPLEFMGYPRDTAFLPVFVNSYAPPQPRPERCFEFGRALHRALERLGISAVIIGSGGLSHYPGTRVYSDPGPDDATDEEIYRKCAEGNFRFLLTYNSRELDTTGNVEVRPLLITAGAMGVERAPDIMLYETNWHHNYAVFGWTAPADPDSEETVFYKKTPVNRIDISLACHQLRLDPIARRDFISDPEAFVGRFHLSDEERAAVIRLDQEELRDEFSVHPILAMLAPVRVRIDREKTSTG